jgi:hypothetical protein
VSYLSLVLDSGDVPYVAFRDDGSVAGKATVMSYAVVGGWQYVGSAGFSSGTADFVSLAIHGTTPWVAFKDNANGGKATVLTYSSSLGWQIVGVAGFSAGVVNDLILRMDSAGNPYIAFSDVANSDKVTVMTYR